MKHRALGRTGIQISPIGLGTAKFGRTELGLAGGPFDLPSDECVFDLLGMAERRGVNLIDTAPAYGESESRLGALLPDSTDWVIVTKVGETFEAGRSSFDFSPEAITQSVESSLSRLGRDVLDVVLLHSDGRDVEILRESGAIEALADLRAQGVVRAIGASTKSIEGGLAAVSLCDVVMVALNEDDGSQLPVVEAAQKCGVGVLIKKPLARGRSTDPLAALRRLSGVPGVSSLVVGTTDADHWESDCGAVESAVG